jgi:hypothetical protein
MEYAFVVNNTIIKADVQLPPSALRLTDGSTINLRDATANDQRACGYFVIIGTPVPALQPNERADRSVELIAGEPTEVWTTRTANTEEENLRIRNANRETLRSIASTTTQLTALREILTDADVATFVGRTNNAPWDATDRRALKTAIRTIDRLTKAVERVTRASFGSELLDDISNT